jgi:hypothetical protein
MGSCPARLDSSFQDATTGFAAANEMVRNLETIAGIQFIFGEMPSICLPESLKSEVA